MKSKREIALEAALKRTVAELFALENLFTGSFNMEIFDDVIAQATAAMRMGDGNGQTTGNTDA